MISKRILTIGLAALAFTASIVTPASANHRNPYHVDRQGTTLAQVNFIDNTGAAWPVNASTVEWNKSTKIKSYYLPGGSSCPHYLCVQVSEVNVANGMSGTAAVNYDPTTGHVTLGLVYLNNYYALDAAGHRHVACQEMGHILALTHIVPAAGAPGTCMNDQEFVTQLPNNHDYFELTGIYNH